jgi:XTP/dITP diphosphohydrolase
VLAGRLALLVTSPQVRPGLLTWQAWRELRDARRVLAPGAGHRLLPALSEAGIAWQVLSPGEEDLAGRLAVVAAESGGTVVWLCGAAEDAGAGTGAAPPGSGGKHGGAGLPGDAELPGASGPGAEGPGDQAAEAAALAEAVAARGVRADIVTGAADLPGGQLIRLVTVMDRLRAECPWDARQTHQSLAPHLLEETYEALEALESGNQAALREELGDVLLQVMFHARVAAERTDGSGYTIDDVAEGIVTKLVRRHPHVFGDVTVSGHEEVKRNWDAIKAAEREAAGGQPPSALDGVPFGQPALALAAQLQRRAARAGVPASLADLRAGEDGVTDLGAALFALVTQARQRELDPEAELRAAARRYRQRVRDWEAGRSKQ